MKIGTWIDHLPELRVVRYRYRGPGMQRAQEGTWVGLVSKSLTLLPAEVI